MASVASTDPLTLLKLPEVNEREAILDGERSEHRSANIIEIINVNEREALLDGERSEHRSANVIEIIKHE